MTNVLIVLAHPDENSLTHRFAAELNDVLTARGAVTGVADLAAEGFEPRFGIDDHDAFLGRRGVSEAETRNENARAGLRGLAKIIQQIRSPICWQYPQV